MITLKGYLAVGLDGTFYVIDVFQTHVGTRAEWRAVDTIDKAELFYAPHCRNRGHGRIDKEPEGGIKFVPASKTVVITLEGFGGHHED